jgi:predicted phosphodiesterase
MRLAVIADIHGNLPALETVLADVDAAGVDKVWVLGDLAAHGGNPAACVEYIRERHSANEDGFQVIGGNTDRYLVTNARSARRPAEDADGYQRYAAQFKVENDVLMWGMAQLGWENYEFLGKLIGKELRLKVDGYGLVMGYHAVPGDDEQNILPDTPDEEALDSVLDRPLRLGLYGHIHRQLDRDLGRVRLVNPGSVGMSFETPGQAQYAILTFEGGAVSVDMRRLPYDVDAAVRALHTAGHPHAAAIEKIYRDGIEKE